MSTQKADCIDAPTGQSLPRPDAAPAGLRPAARPDSADASPASADPDAAALVDSGFLPVILEAMHQGALAVRADGIIDYSNAAFGRLARTPLRFVAGAPIGRFFVPGDQPALADLLKVHNQATSVQVTMLSKDGRRVPVLLDSIPVAAGDKHAALLIVTDLTDKQRSERLQAAERLASAMLEQAAEAIIVCDADGTVIRANHEANLLSGASPLGRPFHQVFRLRLSATGGPAMHTSSSPRWLQDLAHDVRLHSVDGTLLHPSGEVRNVLISLGPLESGHQFMGRVVTIADITARRRAEEALRESEFRLARLTERTPAYIYEVDREGRVVFANRVYQGLSPEQVIGTRYVDWFPPDGRPAIQEALDTCLSRGEAVETEFTVPDVAGLLQRFLVHMAPPKGTDQRGTIVVTATDISSLREAEADRERLMAQLAAEKSRWQATVESMLDPVTVGDAEGRATYMNAAYTRMVNLTIQSGVDLDHHAEHYHLYRPDGTIFKPEDLPLQRAALTGEEVRGQELVQRDPAGGEHVAVWSAAPLRDEQGQVTGAVAVGRDITEQRKAEAERELLLGRLEVEQSRLHAIIDNAPEAILVTDAEGRIVLSNTVADQLYGRPVPYGLEFESQAPFTLCSADGTPCPPQAAPLTRSAREGTVTKSAEMIVLWPDGRSRGLLISTAPLLDADGEVTGAVGIFQDITELEQARRDLRRRTAQLETIRQVGLHLSAELDLDSLLQAILSHAVELLHVDGGLFYLLRPEDDVLEAVVEAGSSEKPVGGLVRRDGGLAGVAWATRRSARAVPSAARPENLGNAAGKGAGDPVAAAAVPVCWGDEVLGVILVKQRPPVSLSDSDVEALELLAAQAAIAIRNARVVAQEADQRRRAEALTQATAVLASTLDLEDLLRRLLSAVMPAIPAAEKGAVLLLDATGARLVPRIQVGYTGLRVGETGFTREDNPLLWATLEGQAILVPDTESGPGPQTRGDDAGFVPLALEPEPPLSAVLAPFRYRGGSNGVVVLTNFSRKAAFGPHDLQLLSAFADQAAVAVENARLYEDAQGKAVLEERQRLARALHDSVTQSLYSLTLFTQTALRRAGAGEMERVQDNLRQISETAAQSLKDMRLLVYELRRTDLEKIGLVAALQQRLNSVEKRAGMVARLDSEERLELPVWAEETLYSIASEALNNSLKHAGASAVQVSLHLKDDRVDLTIKDNGLGFDVQAARESGGLGLTSMRERTEQAGGTLTIETESGKGTTVDVQLPLTKNGRVQVRQLV